MKIKGSASKIILVNITEKLLKVLILITILNFIDNRIISAIIGSIASFDKIFIMFLELVLLYCNISSP